ncbi:hypothetical protein H7I53_17830 [Mycolicibacterium pulveris]|uniref:hypothetical protein n=1 Tax=Mycolicibacterium pulveris TaxID=36813 RepID=UPI0021F31059|nr:hypothetical protein [Mycolicibacterium pulveris]MCV6982078.1 hypothetical protein [Mycolicibacterium pulveris]
MPDIVLDTLFNNPNLNKVVYPGFVDDFNAADGTLDVTTDGKPWIFQRSGSGVNPVWSRSDGAARMEAGAFRSSAVVESGSSDGILTHTIRSAGTNNGGGVVFRSVDGANYWVLQWRDTGSDDYYALKKLVEGTTTAVEGGATTVSNTDGDVVSIEFIGTDITVSVNGGEPIITLTGQTDFLTAEKHGLYSSTTSEDFSERWESIEFVAV